MEKFVPCRKCKAKAGSSIPEGWFLVPETGLLRECTHHIEWRKEAELERRLSSLGFPQADAIPHDFSTYAGEKSKKTIERLKAYVLCFFDQAKRDAVKKSVLYFYGGNGTQKTTVASVVGRQIVRAGLSCRFILMKSLIDLLWNSQRDEEAAAEVKRLSECDVLIVDEAFSKDKIHLWASGNQIGYVDEFLRERLGKGLGSIFISNTKPEEIEEQGFSHSIQDLVLRELKKQDALLTFEDVYFDSVSLSEIPERLF